jgi:biotin transport system substrate-specific component
MKLRPMIYAALFAAVLCVLAPLTIVIPVSPVPLSLATFVIYIAASSINWKTGTIAVALYLLIGCIGLPVFSGFTGGAQKLVGPTGGFLIGYIPCAFIIGLLIDKFGSKKWLYPAAMIAGTAVLYALGTIWIMVSLKYTLAAALAACVLPFLPGDAVKIILASVAGPQLRWILSKQRG